MPLERILANFKDSGQSSTSAYDPAEPESYEQYVQAVIRDARDYEGSILAPARDLAQKYYYGYLPTLNNDGTPSDQTLVVEDPANTTYGDLLGETSSDANRSQFVSTDVRDAILLMLPGLIRLFGASESPINFVARNEAEVDVAEQATDYVNYVFWNDNPGFLNLYGALKDAMTVRTGFLKWWTDNTREVQRKTFVNITQEQVQQLQAEDPSVKIHLHSPLDKAIGTYAAVTAQYETSKPLIKCAGVPPEEMRLDRYARSFATSRFVGHERLVPLDELVAMGYDRELCKDHIQGQGTPEFTQEAQLRNPGRYISATRVGDGVMYGEWFIKIDNDNDGVAELRHICTMGENAEIVSDEDANRIKIAVFGVDPISHTIVGDSIADLTQDIQNIKTNVIRAVLDSAAESINPKTVVNELTTNLDDALNDDLGAVIRTRGDPNSAVAFNAIPFLGQAMLPVIELLNDQLQRRTGLTDAAKGLDPKALQSSTQIGVDAIINGAQERVELVARVLCETGFKDLFKGLYAEVCENPNVRRTIRMRGKFVPYDTSTFDPSLSVEVNPNLGKGGDMVRMIALQQIDQKQQLIVQTYGLNNPVCGIPEMLNTVTDMLALANVKNVSRYFRTPTPEALQAITSAPKTPDPQAVAAQAMLEKVRAEAAKNTASFQLDTQKHQADNSFKHQQLHAKTLVDLQKLELEGQKIGVDTHTKMATLASQLMKDQSDQEGQDQANQIQVAQADQDRQAQEQQNQQAQNEQELKAAELASKHMQSMAGLASQHSQAMTKMAVDHHQAMTGIGSQEKQTGAKLIAGALSQGADHAHASSEADLDREHQERATAATLTTQKDIAKAKPKVRPK